MQWMTMRPRYGGRGPQGARAPEDHLAQHLGPRAQLGDGRHPARQELGPEGDEFRSSGSHPLGPSGIHQLDPQRNTCCSTQAARLSRPKAEQADARWGILAYTPETLITSTAGILKNATASECDIKVMDTLNATTVFYSWQSNSPGAANRGLIRQALEQAIRGLHSDGSIVDSLRLDHDTQGVPGSPDIGETILAKVAVAAVFVADVSLVMRDQSTGRKSPNPNVLFELGFAWAKLGHARVIMVMNEHFGLPSELPFDLRSRRALVYRNDPIIQERSASRNGLATDLQTALKSVLAGRPQAKDSRAPAGATPISPRPIHNAASVIAKQDLDRLYYPRRAMYIEPNQEDAEQVDRLRFIRQIAQSELPLELAIRAGFSSLRGSERRSGVGVVWVSATSREHPMPRVSFEKDVDRVVAVGFDGSLFVASCLDEEATSRNMKSMKPVDVGQCIDTIVGTIVFSARIRNLLCLRRAARATFFLEGITGLHAVFRDPSPAAFHYPPNPPQAHADALQKSFNVPMKFDIASIKEVVTVVCNEVGYVFGTPISSEYIEYRVRCALNEAGGLS